MEIQKEKTVAFTGYRTSKMFKGNVSIDRITALKTEIYLVIKELYHQGYTTFLSGMSEGFDMIAAETVLELKKEYSEINLIAVVPFNGQDERYNLTDKLTYAHLLEFADDTRLLSESYIDNSQYLIRNDFLLANCSHVVCYYDGQRGGTMYTVNRAVKKRIPITNVYL